MPPAWQPPEWVLGELGGATGRGVRVAVVDSGWDRTLQDERVLPGIGFVHPEDDFGKALNDDDHDMLGHGTACAEVILSVAPDARIIPVKVFGKVLETSPPTIYAAVQWCIEAGVQIINVSLGTRREDMLKPLYTACEIARRAGIIVVAAGPNAGEESYPAIFEPVIGVSAGRFESPYHFRYRADDAMECEAWGVERPVLWIGGRRVVRGGTSFAAPNVSGIVALILERHPGATIEQVREMLARFALPGGQEAADVAVPLPGVPQPKPARKRRRSTTQVSKAADEAAAPEKGTRPRKRAAAPARKPDKATTAKKSDKATSAKPAAKAAKPSRRAAASTEAAPAAADKKPRKRTASAKSGSKAAPARSGTRSRKPAAAKAADEAAKPLKSRRKGSQPVKVVPGTASPDAAPAAERARRGRKTDRSVRAASRRE